MITNLLFALLIGGASLLTNSHDITSLPQWGPYSKQYAGISHVPDVSKGIRVDVSVAPGLYRHSNVCVPSALYESGCYPWEVSPDLRHITYRQEIEWKDRVFVDVTYHVVDDGMVLMEMHCVNNTGIPQSLLLHSMMSLHYADVWPKVEAKGADACVRAVDYDSYEPAVRKPAYALVYDGAMRGEKKDADAIAGNCVATSGEAGDVLCATLPGHSGKVWMRCRAPKSATVEVDVCGKRLSIRGTGAYELVSIPCPGTALKLTTCSKGVLQIDSFLLGDNVSVALRPTIYTPALEISKGQFIAKYDALDGWYGMAWNYPLSNVNEYVSSSVDLLMKTKANDHVDKVFYGDRNGHFTSAFQRPVMMKASSDTTIWNMVATGTKEAVASKLAAFHADEASFTSRAGSYHFADDRLLDAAAPYITGDRILQATILTNIVYPVWTQKQYIRHFTPGMNWNSLYTWDSGMISSALNDIDADLAFENIRAYTTEPGCQSAFIHHGTPLPIQFFAFEDLCSKTCDVEKIGFLYPRLKQYYEFMVGRGPGSTTRMPSGLIRTWDYFYNSGGWDDYPPQWYLREHPELYPTVAPMISTSCYIRASKILRMTARMLGLKNDVKVYDNDIKTMSAAILDNAWDEENGYFGYVTHDAGGKPVGLFKASDGSNFNMGLDGISPLLAGIGSDAQKRRMQENLFSPRHLWTPYGISTVDQSASYYRIDGYWNGCNWIPHQFLQWKAMLDLGNIEGAHKIAMTGLDTWSAEVSESYQCYEHFLVGNGRGCGWHNFSGLSSPVVNWFTSYFRKGTVTTGFDTMVTTRKWSADFSRLEAELSFDKDAAGRETVVLVCMAPASAYEAVAGGKKLPTYSPYEGLCYVTVPASAKGLRITVTTKQ